MILDDFIVVDNAISTTFQNQIEEYMHNKQPWWFQSDITFSDLQINEFLKVGVSLKKRFGWGSMIFDKEKNYGTTNHLVTSVLYNAVDAANVKLNDITLIRGFMSSPINNQEIDRPHVDRPGMHLVCIYYVNNSDGDTIIFDKMNDDSDINQYLNPNEQKVLTKISPKKGRCLIFDGRHYHASTPPSNDVRTVINFNFS